MVIPTLCYLDENGTLSDACKHRIADDILVSGLRTMLITRHVDERMVTLQRQGTISFALSSRGEEACAVASAAALELSDWMYPQYREVGIMFWRGYKIVDYVHHMFCNGRDIILGRQMPNHFGSRALNVVTVSSPLGTKISHAAGCADAMRLLKESAVAICYFGEGSSSKEDFHTGLNFASLRRVPAIFFCRNNQYAISTRADHQFRGDGVACKGGAYGMTTFRIDGNDFYAVHETVAKARQLCLEGQGPILIEAMTYRLGAHSTSDDPSVYRKDDEVHEWEKKDPIVRLRSHLLKRGLWSDEQEQKLLTQVKEEVDAAIQEAKQTPPPPLDSLIKDVYFEVPHLLKEELEEVKKAAGEVADNA